MRKQIYISFYIYKKIKDNFNNFYKKQNYKYNLNKTILNF